MSDKIIIPFEQINVLRRWLRKEVFLPTIAEIERDQQRNFTRYITAVALLEDIGWAEPPVAVDVAVQLEGYGVHILTILDAQRELLNREISTLKTREREKAEVRVKALADLVAQIERPPVGL
jgi:hypothetical protein